MSRAPSPGRAALASDRYFLPIDGQRLGPAPPAAFAAVRDRTGLGFLVHQRLLWGALGKADLSQTPWAKFDEVWS